MHVILRKLHRSESPKCIIFFLVNLPGNQFKTMYSFKFGCQVLVLNRKRSHNKLKSSSQRRKKKNIKFRQNGDKMNTLNGNVCNYIESVRSIVSVKANIHLHRSCSYAVLFVLFCHYEYCSVSVYMYDIILSLFACSVTLATFMTEACVAHPINSLRCVCDFKCWVIFSYIKFLSSCFQINRSTVNEFHFVNVRWLRWQVGWNSILRQGKRVYQNDLKCIFFSFNACRRKSVWQLLKFIWIQRSEYERMFMCMCLCEPPFSKWD